MTPNLDRANTDIAQLLRRFENIVALAPVRSLGFHALSSFHNHFPGLTLWRAARDGILISQGLLIFPSQLESHDCNTTAVEAYQMEVETAALVCLCLGPALVILPNCAIDSEV